MSMCEGPAVTQNLGFPGTGSGSVWLQHGPRCALGSELGIALNSTVVKKPPVAESGGGQWGSMHRWEVGVLGVPAVWWSSRFRCGMDRGDEAVTDWSLMVGGPVIGGGWDKDLHFPHWSGRL